jgi:F0F1-type ATP synthase assembly protein I
LRRLVAAQRTYSGVQVRNSIAYGRRVAVRTTLLQIVVTILAASIASMFGSRIGLATLAGGAIIAVGNWLFAMRLFGRGVAPARNALRSAYMAEVLKWFWLCLALYLAIAIFRMPFAGLIAGVMAAQFSFWIALLAIR